MEVFVEYRPHKQREIGMEIVNRDSEMIGRTGLDLNIRLYEPNGERGWCVRFMGWALISIYTRGTFFRPKKIFFTQIWRHHYIISYFLLMLAIRDR